jgi:hypothetical protein
MTSASGARIPSPIHSRLPFAERLPTTNSHIHSPNDFKG